MLSSSHSKIHEPPVTGVSRRPPDRRPAAAKLRNTRGQAVPLQPLPRRTTTKIDDVWRRDRFGGLMREYQQVA
jgi:hypothetical protein